MANYADHKGYPSTDDNWVVTLGLSTSTKPLFDRQPWGGAKAKAPRGMLRTPRFVINWGFEGPTLSHLGFEI